MLGVVAAPSDLAPRDPGPALVAAPPVEESRSLPGPDPAPQPAAAPPTDVLAEQVVAPAAPVAEAVEAAVPVVVQDGPPEVLVPAALDTEDACLEIGPLSGLVDGAVEPTAAAIAPPLGTVVDTLDCTAVVPVENLLSGLLGG
jgi:hypothetical protein